MCACATNLVLDRVTNTVRSTDDGDTREWVDPLGRSCPADAGEPYYHPGHKAVTDGVYWWHLPYKKSAQLVIESDLQPE